MDRQSIHDLNSLRAVGMGRDKTGMAISTVTGITSTAGGGGGYGATPVSSKIGHGGSGGTGMGNILSNISEGDDGSSPAAVISVVDRLIKIPMAKNMAAHEKIAEKNVVFFDSLSGLSTANTFLVSGDIHPVIHFAFVFVNLVTPIANRICGI